MSFVNKVQGGLYSEFGAAHGAATRDDQATLVRGHANAKAVSVAAFGFFGLIGSLHNLKS